MVVPPPHKVGCWVVPLGLLVGVAVGVALTTWASAESLYVASAVRTAPALPLQATPLRRLEDPNPLYRLRSGPPPAKPQAKHPGVGPKGPRQTAEDVGSSHHWGFAALLGMSMSALWLALRHPQAAMAEAERELSAVYTPTAPQKLALFAATGAKVIKPKIRGFICTTAHPTGAAAKVQKEIQYVKANPPAAAGPKKVLIIGASTGYGLSTRIATTFGYGASTIGCFFERPSERNKPASAGWYNSVAFEKAAHAAGLYATSINGDAFSDEIKAQTVERIKQDLGQVDLVVYSLASPVRVDPVDNVMYRSVLKPIGQSFENRTLLTDKDQVSTVKLEPASEQEIQDTVKVMGGEDWERWINALSAGGVLAEGAKTVAYSYIGPEMTWPVYWSGTIGQAKKDVEGTASRITAAGACTAYTAVAKAVVTQASSAIPVVPLYITLLFKVMKEKGTHEGCIEQMVRMLGTRLYPAEGGVVTDDEGRIRVDDWEMAADVQEAVAAKWNTIETETLDQDSDYAGYQADFLELFGFGLEGVDYEQPVEVDLPMPSFAPQGESRRAALLGMLAPAAALLGPGAPADAESYVKSLGLRGQTNVDVAGYQRTASGLQILEARLGEGEKVVQVGDRVELELTGRLAGKNGLYFFNTNQTGEPVEYTVGDPNMIAGFTEGLLGMKEKGIRRLVVPEGLGYPDPLEFPGPIPDPVDYAFREEVKSVVNTNSRDCTLVFDVKVVKIRRR
uniref:peptidylprolyl isomerase n=1 Tax=Eutreptiella gymnastica TaxID=73025 RepID=A0A7S1I7Y7_9EUGL